MTMNAVQVCDYLIRTLKASGSNFYLEESPFAVNIEVKKTFIKNHAGVEVHPDIDNFPCMKCNAADKTVAVKGCIGEEDEKFENLNDAFHELSIKLDKAINELSETIVDKNNLVMELREAKKVINEKIEENTLEIKQYKKDLEKKNKEFAKEVKKSEVLAENLLLTEARLSNLKFEEKGVYNVETNNNFEILDEKNKVKSESKDKDNGKQKETKTKVDHSNYKECLKNFLENYREHSNDDPKYKEAAMKMLDKGHNIFHISLLDVGLYDTNLKICI